MLDGPEGVCTRLRGSHMVKLPFQFSKLKKKNSDLRKGWEIVYS